MISRYDKSNRKEEYLYKGLKYNNRCTMKY